MSRITTPQSQAEQATQQAVWMAMGALVAVPAVRDALVDARDHGAERTVRLMQGLEGAADLTMEAAVTVRPERPDDFPEVQP